MTDKAFPDIIDATNHLPERSFLTQLFPAPWRVEAHTESFVIRDAASKPLGYVYFAESWHQPNHNLLTRDEAWSVANNIAKLPNLMKEPG